MFAHLESVFNDLLLDEVSDPSGVNLRSSAVVLFSVRAHYSLCETRSGW